MKRLGITLFIISTFSIFFFVATQKLLHSQSTARALLENTPIVLGAEHESDSRLIERPVSFPYRTQDNEPAVTAKAVVVYDQATNTFLYTKEGNKELPIASLMKLVTTLVSVESLDMNGAVVVPSSVTQIDGSEIHLLVGETFLRHDLVQAALIASANDAAHTLAVTSPQGYEGFVTDMNEFVSGHGLRHTHINNPVGYDFNGQYSSASDVARIFNMAIKSEMLNGIMQTTSETITGSTREYFLRNTNQLLGSHSNVMSGKTGTSEIAGQNLAFSWDVNNRTMIGVLLGSSQRYTDAAVLMSWVEQSYVW